MAAAITMKRTGHQRRRPFTPFETPTSPPPGLYDPSLDAQQRAGDRGLAQLLSDLSKTGSRSDTQYQLDQETVNRGVGRNLADLLTRESRGAQDYGSAVAGLERNYQRLGNKQRQGAVAAGVDQGGALAASMKKRAANEAIDRAPIDTSFQRMNEDIGQQRARVGEDQTLSVADLARRYGYGQVDSAEQGQRAQDENTFFHQDVGAQKFFQAGQQGYTLPEAPKNEFRDAQGNPYQVRIEGNERVTYDPSGRVISRRFRNPPRRGRGI